MSTIKQIKQVQIILFVSDQQASCGFYQKLLRKEPELNVPGMTEFELSDALKLGLMPNKGIARILGDKVPHPDSRKGIPGCELYFYVKNVQIEFENALRAGAQLISPVADRDWGDKVCYFADADGHIIAFAEKISRQNENGNALS
ncbi:MAG: VOC family protein [Lentimicrobium sp.]|jgi:uncharacterized glyoxalase superfamily protein PhnB|nr:lactoylglutathione lyase [Lentimicrobiaceae bacterium]MDY0026122.1 VOC family protein [Lentimicrobium sp.]